MGSQGRTFVDATDRAPCPVCGAHKRCWRARDGRTVACYRESTWQGRPGRPGADAMGERWTWHLDDEGQAAAVAVPDLTPPGGPAAPLAPVEVRDAVYRAALAALPLAPEHRRALVEVRRFPPAEVARRGYGTLPPVGDPWPRERIAKALVNRFGPDACAGVPGVVCRESKRTGRPYWTIAGAAGLLIPVRDLEARIVALLVRADAPDARGKYLAVSSAKDGGPSPGAPCHVPLQLDGGPAARGGTVAIGEGVLKSDALAALCPARLPYLGIPGHSVWRSALPRLAALGPRAVRYYPDPDAWDPTNPAIGRSLHAFWRALKAAGYTPELGRFPGC